MQQPVFKPFTADEYFELPEDGKRYQLIAGDLHMSPSPNTRHQIIVQNLFFELEALVRRSKCGRVFVAPFDVRISDIDVYQPDICFYSRERAECITRQGARGAPDLVVEVLSPSTERYDRGPKLRQYGISGVKELWMVETEANTLAVYRLKESAEPVALLGRVDTLESPLFEGLRIELAAVFE